MATPGLGQETSAAWRATRTMAAEEAHQAAAADERYVYAIGSRVIGKYDRMSGERIGLSEGKATHLNSGFLWNGRLYCAHSNYPAKPERSEVMIFDPETLQLAASHRFADAEGSLTWVVRHGDAWWCNFAFYDADNGQSYLARMNDDWQEEARWSYPAELVRRLGRYSLSGGVWYGDDLLTTDHDHRVLYQLRVPDGEGELVLVDEQPAPFAGQGIAIDPATDGLVGIVRRERVVIFAEPEATEEEMEVESKR